MKYKRAFPGIKGRVSFNEPLSRHTTFRTGGACEVWVEPRDEADLREVLRFTRSVRKKVFIIGAGSNIVSRDRGFDGIAIHLGGRRFKTVRFAGTKVTAGAGAVLSRLVEAACKRGLRGIEGLAGIPGTVGGAVFMNSGYKGNISDCLEGVRAIDKSGRDICAIKRKNLAFGYRHSNLDRYIILEATLRLKRDRKSALLKKKNELLSAKRKTQPLELHSAGCVFRNPKGGVSAAQYVDMAGLKGRRIGNAKISEKHANFIVNLKGAKASDILRLISLARRRVKSRFNVDLLPEVIIL